ncbi:MAG TPA: FtsX-like permease family protein [Terriglobales bacterium]|nr:FtsX-like permease family protein [Terriglobales bacterium]
MVRLAGLAAYSVSQRYREISRCAALGARSQDVLTLVLKEASALLLTGILIGTTLAILAERGLAAVSSTVGNVNSRSSSDPLIIVGAPLLLGVLALFACYVPGRKSTKLDPMTALRHE